MLKAFLWAGLPIHIMPFNLEQYSCRLLLTNQEGFFVFKWSTMMTEVFSLFR